MPSLARFRRYDELLEEAAEAHDPELRFLVQVIARYGRALPGSGRGPAAAGGAAAGDGGAGAGDGAQGQGPGVAAGAALG